MSPSLSYGFLALLALAGPAPYYISLFQVADETATIEALAWDDAMAEASIEHFRLGTVRGRLVRSWHTVYGYPRYTLRVEFPPDFYEANSAEFTLWPLNGEYHIAYGAAFVDLDGERILAHTFPEDFYDCYFSPPSATDPECLPSRGAC